MKECRIIRGDAGAVIWLGPDEWLVVSELATPETQEAGLRAAVTPSGGAAVDVSGQRVSLTLRGRHVRDILAKGCALDLHHTDDLAGNIELALDLAGATPVLKLQLEANKPTGVLLDRLLAHRIPPVTSLVSLNAQA